MLRGSGTRPTSKQSDLRARSAVSDLYISEALAVSDELFTDACVRKGDDVGGEVTGILAVADADGGHRDSRGHLHNAVQGIDAVERAAGAGQANDRKDCVPCEHAREGCSEASNTDEDLKASPGGFASILRGRIRGTVCREDVELPRDAELVEHRGDLVYSFLVGLATRNDTDLCIFFQIHLRILLN